MISQQVIQFGHLLRAQRRLGSGISQKKETAVVRSDDLCTLPPGLPVPLDDGACDHLRGLRLPGTRLAATSGETVDVSKEGNPWLVIYCYPRTGRPDQEPPGGLLAWNAIPGARGCTPQSSAYRDNYEKLTRLGATVYGLSTQDSGYQAEAVQRLRLPYPLLSDAALKFAGSLRLPAFTVAGSRLIKRLTLIARAGRVEEVFYPVFPPDADAGRVVEWLATH
jgi:peroxiredoxin